MPVRVRVLRAALVALALLLAEQRRILDGAEAEAPSRGFLLHAYGITPPPPCRKLGLAARRQAWTPWDLPPVSVWRYWHDDVRALP